MPDDKQSGGVNIDKEGELDVGGDIVGRDKRVEINEGGPVARYAVTGIIVVAVVALLINYFRPAQPTPTSVPIVIATQTSALTTAVPTDTPLSLVTNTPRPSPVEPTATTLPSPTTPPLTPETIYFRSGCILAAQWNAYPRVTASGECLAAPGFLAQDDGTVIKLKKSTVEEQQYGIYLPLAGDVEVQFTLELKQFLSPNDKSNLSFGVLNIKDGFSYVNGSVYLCYFAAKRSIDVSIPRRINPGDSLCATSVGALTFDAPERIKFSVRGAQLTITLDDRAVHSDFLGFERRAFYIGYDLHSTADLSAAISDFSVQSR